MTSQTKKVFVVLGIGLGAYVAYSIYQAIQAGVTGLQNLLMAPFNALANEATAVTQTAQNISAGNTAAAAIATQNNNIYAPGGSEYNQILATQGQAAADAAWATVQSHQQTEDDQTSNPLLGALGL